MDKIWYILMLILMVISTVVFIKSMKVTNKAGDNVDNDTDDVTDNNISDVSYNNIDDVTDNNIPDVSYNDTDDVTDNNIPDVSYNNIADVTDNNISDVISDNNINAIVADNNIPDEIGENIESVTENENASVYENKPRKKISKSAILFIVTLILLIISLFSDLETYKSAYKLMTIVVVAEFLISKIYCKFNSELLKAVSKVLFAVSFLELTVFNFMSYQMFLLDYKEECLDLENAYIEIGVADIDLENNCILIDGKNEVVVTFNDLNKKIGSICTNILFENDTEITKVVVDMGDETHQEYRYDVAKADVLPDIDSSKYISCAFSGNVGDFRIKFTGYDDNHKIVVSDIIINKPIPFEVSYLRVLLFFVILLFAYSLLSVSEYKEPFEKKKKLCGMHLAVTTILFCFIAFCIVDEKMGDDKTFKSEMKLNYGNQITEELVEAFKNKQLSLMMEPDESILNVENPYDWGQRGTANAQYEWDHLLYDGKYYSYYGVAPVLLFYLPYNLITGYYCSTHISILLFSIVGLIFLTLTYNVILKKYYSTIPAGMAIAGHLILMCANGIWFSVARNIFYEISISCGFMFVTMGTFFLFSSNVIGKGKVSCVKIFLSSLFLAIAVLCRPTLAVYCICACIYIIYGFLKKEPVIETESQKKPKHVNKVIYTFCAVLPYVVFGGFQMWYNMARFGSPLDFGIQYSLTINDFTHSQYHFIFVMIGVFNYLFAVPSFIPQYPFVTTEFSRFDANGYYFSDSGNTSGIVFLALPVFGYLLSKKALDKLPDKKSKIKSLLIVGIPCVVMPLIILFSVWESGYAVRYTADFSWQVILGAYAILFSLYIASEDKTKKDLLYKFMVLSSVYAIFVNGFQIFNFTFSQEEYARLCYITEHIFAFWK